MGGTEFTIPEFRGLDNKRAPESLAEYDRNTAATHLTAAINVDISRDGSVGRRKGFTLQDTGNYHSLWSNNEIGFAVKDNHLISINTDLTMTTLRPASERFVSYADTEVGIYLSDNQFMARYVDGTLTVLAKAGTYVPISTSLDPSEDSSLYDYPPPCSLLMWMYGRLWTATDDAVFYSRGYLPDQFNLADDYIDMPGVVLLAPVDGGYYIGTEEKVQFVNSGNPKAPATVTTVCHFGAIPRTQHRVDANLLKIEGASGEAVVWESSRGKVAGFSGGRVVLLTDSHVSYPAGSYGASLIRKLNGEVHHLSTIATRDSDSSNMRTSDTAVAEIVRNGKPI